MSAATGTIIAGAGVLGAGATVAGSLIGKSAAGDAANAQIQAAQRGLEFQQQQADKAAQALQSNYAPFVDAQKNALGQAVALTDPNNPLYQQQRQVMTEAIQRQLAAQGLLRSKNQSDLLTNLELGLAQQRANQVNMLAGSGAAQSLGANLAGIYGGLGGAGASAFGQMGQAQAQNALASGQAMGSLFTGLNNVAQGTYGNYLAGQRWDQQMGLLQKIVGGGGGAAPAGVPAMTPLVTKGVGGL